MGERRSSRDADSIAACTHATPVNYHCHKKVCHNTNIHTLTYVRPNMIKHTTLQNNVFYNQRLAICYFGAACQTLQNWMHAKVPVNTHITELR